ncbi:hypothetical protein O0L34_g9407 [Tuta absoluta]|nr:hypothetical protein O0L34_g9407 [Tuta absoluta]
MEATVSVSARSSVGPKQTARLECDMRLCSCRAATRRRCRSTSTSIKHTNQHITELELQYGGDGVGVCAQQRGAEADGEVGVRHEVVLLPRRHAPQVPQHQHQHKAYQPAHYRT